MNLEFILDEVVPWTLIGVEIFSLNQILSALGFRCWGAKARNEAIREKRLSVPDSILEELRDFVLPANAGVFEYLSLANWLVYVNEDLERGNDISAQGKDEPVCRHYAATTFETYQRLVVFHNRRELADQVRFALNSGLREKESVGHIYLQYKDGGRIRSFETFDYRGDRLFLGRYSNSFTSEGLEKLKKEREVGDLEVESHSKWGTDKYRMNFNGFMYLGGCARLFKQRILSFS